MLCSQITNLPPKQQTTMTTAKLHKKKLTDLGLLKSRLAQGDQNCPVHIRNIGIAARTIWRKVLADSRGGSNGGAMGGDPGQVAVVVGDTRARSQLERLWARGRLREWWRGESPGGVLLCCALFCCCCGVLRGGGSYGSFEMKGIGRGRCEEERKRKRTQKKDPGSLFKQFFLHFFSVRSKHKYF
ncbi:hypothetical protein K457DRAFT_506697 [Linnemannia elongata AG-77]|uniref:Uncharacterized protein n=1 Tax=Linnemannia elongata AG-77 TaxID=1314771 RepID=A0A197JYU1_9FUNG|nr:hypothetical protein K457DRAFT_506697 [Linnemannia elongata AG-77]